ncbi:MAG: hypothetical protein WC584_00515 [Candidatus Pacearchaeota archaeon]
MTDKFRLEDLNGEVLGKQEINGIYEFNKERNLNSDKTFSPCNSDDKYKDCIVCRCADTCNCEDHCSCVSNVNKNSKATTGCLSLLIGIVGAGYEIYKLIEYL